MGKEGVKGRKEARKVVLLLLSTVFGARERNALLSFLIIEFSPFL